MSCTRGWPTPSSAVNVAANVPTVEHVTVVLAAVGSAKMQVGLSLVQVRMGVPKGSTYEPSTAMGVLTVPETSGPALTVVLGPPATTLIEIRIVAGTLHVAAMDVYGGAVPSATVEVRTFSTMLIVDPAAPAVTLIVRFGVVNVPGAIGPTVAIEIVSGAGNVTESGVATPSISVGPSAAMVPCSNVPPCTWYEVERSEYEWT